MTFKKEGGNNIDYGVEVIFGTMKSEGDRHSRIR